MSQPLEITRLFRAISQTLRNPWKTSLIGLSLTLALTACGDDDGPATTPPPPPPADGGPLDSGPVDLDSGPIETDSGPPDLGPPPIPTDGPGLEIISPTPGQELGGDGATSIAVIGRVLDTSSSPRLYVNGQTTWFEPTTGEFSVAVAPTFGVVHIEVVATDGISRGESEAQMDVLWAGHYEPPPADATSAAVSFPDAISLRLGQSFFDDDVGLPAEPPAGEPFVLSDIADIVEIVLRNYDIRAALPDPVVDNSTMTLRVTDVRPLEVRATVDVTDGGLELFVQVGRLEADTEGRLDLAGDVIDLAGGVHATVSGFARLSVTKPEGMPADVRMESLTLVVESAESDFVSEEANAIFRLGEGLLRSTLETQLQNGLSDSIEQSLPEVIRGVLDSLDRALQARSFSLGGSPFPMVTVDIDGRLQALETVHRSHFGTDLSGRISTPAVNVFPGSRGVPVATAELGRAPFFRVPRTQVAVRASVLNGVLHSLWSAGLLEIDLSSLPPDALGGLTVTGNLSGRMTPVLRPALVGEPADLVLSLGQLELDAEVGGVRTKFGISLDAGVSIDFVDDAFRFEVAMTPAIRVWTIEAPPRAGLLSEDLLRSVLMEQLWPVLREAVTSGLALPIPISELDAINALSPALSSLTFTLEMRDRARMQDDFLFVDMALVGTLPVVP